MLQCFDGNHRPLRLLGGFDGAHLQQIGVFLEQLIGHVGDSCLGSRGLSPVFQAQSQHHLALPQGDGIDQRGLDLL